MWRGEHITPLVLPSPITPRDGAHVPLCEEELTAGAAAPLHCLPAARWPARGSACPAAGSTLPTRHCSRAGPSEGSPLHTHIRGHHYLHIGFSLVTHVRTCSSWCSQSNTADVIGNKLMKISFIKLHGNTICHVTTGSKDINCQLSDSQHSTWNFSLEQRIIYTNTIHIILKSSAYDLVIIIIYSFIKHKIIKIYIIIFHL